MFAAALHLTAEGTLGKYRGPLRAAHPWTWKEARAQHICFGDDAAAFITTPWGWVLATGRLDVPLAHNAGEIAAHIANLHTTSRAPEAWLADLRGAFAFAIWNEPKQTLYCVRDHFGVEPLYYLHEGDVFAFASESHLLRPLAHDPRIDKEYLAEYLLAVNTRPQRTIYAAVNTLLGATLLELRRKHLTLRRYWTPKPKLTERHAPLSMHIAALRETFRRAVHRRVGDKTALGLSAGLDSGSIAAFLPPRDKPYPAITLHFPNSDADETHLMGAYATDPRLAWHKLEELPRVADSERQLLHPDGPAIEPNAMFFLALTAAAAQLDSTIFLDGHDGDGVIGHGYAYLTDLARHGDLLKLGAQAHALAKRTNRPFTKILKSRALLPLLRQALPPWVSRSFHRRARILGPELEDLRQQIEARQRQQSAALSSAAENHARHLTSPHYSLVLTHLRQTTHNHVDCRHPFLDIDVIEASLAFPESLRLHNGWNRWILRAAFGAELPRAVQRQAKKIILASPVLALFRGPDRPYFETFVNENAGLGNLFDAEYLRQTWITLIDPNTPRSQALHAASIVWRAVLLSRWLVIHKSLPHTPSGGNYEIGPQAPKR